VGLPTRRGDDLVEAGTVRLLQHGDERRLLGVGADLARFRVLAGL
jgi:hypothetical protein